MNKILLLCPLLLIAISCSDDSSDSPITSEPPTNEAALTCVIHDDCTLSRYTSLATSPDDCGCMPFTYLGGNACYKAVNVAEADARESAYQTYCKAKENEETPENCAEEIYCRSGFFAVCIDGKCVSKQSD